MGHGAYGMVPMFPCILWLNGWPCIGGPCFMNTRTRGELRLEAMICAIVCAMHGKVLLCPSLIFVQWGARSRLHGKLQIYQRGECASCRRGWHMLRPTWYMKLCNISSRPL